MGLQRAFFKNLDTKDQKQLEVQFNPSDLSFGKGSQFAEIAIPGLDAPVLQFVRGATETLTVELFFDTTEHGMADGAKSVTEQVDTFYNLVKQRKDTHAPPRCLFGWGRTTASADANVASPSEAPFRFVCVVESIDRKFLLFSPEGIPLRARLTVKLREYKTVEDMAKNLQSADLTKSRVLKRHQRLDQIAAEEYASPAEWRVIAERNGIDDPRRIPPGTLLEVPPLPTPAVTRSSG